MKIKYLKIEEYKNLKDFEINFESDNPISIFIGDNGSGKSNMLEAIVLIFKYLLLAETDIPLLKYSIKYDIGENSISIIQDDLNGYNITINDERKDLSFLRSVHAGTRYLPDNILIYYSGFNKRMQNYAQKFDDDYRRSVEKSGNNSKRHMFYVNPDYFPLILLSMLSSDLTSLHKFILEKFNIERIKEFSIKFKKPHWAKSNTTIETFWGAKDGNVKSFLNILKLNCDKFLKGNTFQFSGDKLKTIRENELIGYDRDLYKMLDATYLNDLIENVSVTLLKTTGETVNDYNFSEGERQLLTIRGLVEFFDNKETLYLFDEPDTFLHPTWQRDFVGEIANYLSTMNHFLITTHSPLILNNAKQDVANIFKFIDGKVFPSINQYGTDIEAVNFKMMDVENRPEEIKKQISSLYDFIELEDIKNAEQVYSKLVSTLGEDDKDLIQTRIEIDFLKEEDDVEN